MPIVIRSTLEAKFIGILTAQELHDIAISEACGLDTIDEDLR